MSASTALGGAILAVGALVAFHPGATNEAPATKLMFAGTEFHHRWSKDGQNEYTPKGEEDLGRWSEMITINVHDRAVDGDGLAEVANAVVERYRAAGTIIRTNSIPMTKKRPAEHFIAAILGTPELTEAALARFLLRDGVGTVVVYSRRAYGPDAAATIGAWIEKNGEATEKRLMEWKGLPALGELRKLPQR